MEILDHFLVLCIFLGFSEAVDPCTSYNTIHDKFRSADYYVKDVPYERLLCDYAKFDGRTWYRFYNGSTLTSKCVTTYHCGTHLPMWMNGAQPSVGEGIVDREICAPRSDDTNCCDEKFNIRVKSCGSFYVYELKSPPGCSMSYCAGTGTPCPPDKWSRTGYEPNCIDLYPKLLHNPHLSNPIVKNDTFEFHCDVNFDPSRTDVGFDIEWMFNNKTDPNVPGTTITGSDRSASLDQRFLEHHMGQEVSCKVRAFNTGIPTHMKGPFIPSNTYWAGIKLSKTSMSVSEKGGSEKVDIISTVPIICAKRDQHICHLDIVLDNNGPDIRTTQKCTYRIHSTDWNSSTNEAKTTIEIQALRDFQKDGDKNLVLHFHPLYSADGPRIFQHYNISYLHIRSNDAASSTCLCTGDPHCKTFDYFLRSQHHWPKDYYDYYKIGEFMMYENKQGNVPSQVQVRTWSCGHVTCACAVAAREGNDIVVIDMCQGHYGKSFPQLFNQAISHGASVTKDESGHNYLIDFPSGLQVKVTANVGHYLDIKVTAPSDAQKNTGGLCGYFDEDRSNDLKYADGKIENFNGVRFQPKQFVESWRIPLGTSLFDQKNTIVPNTKYDPFMNYCECDQTTGNPDCRIDNNVKRPTVQQRCSSCKVQVLSSGAKNGRKKRSSSYTNADYDPVIYFYDYGLGYTPNLRSFPTENGKTKSDAEKACNDVFDNNPVLQSCIREAGMDFTPEKNICVEDFKYFDDGSFIGSALDAAIEVCRYTILPDPKYYQNGTPPAYITTDLCPNHCSGNGLCYKGICSCNHGYTGDGCEINTLVPPTLHYVVSTYKDSIICDVTTRPCNLMFVAGDNMLHSSRLSCKVQLHEYDGAKFVDSGRHFVTGTVYNNMYHVGCKLPTTSMTSGHTNVKYSLSISNDGHQYSNTVDMIKLDSACFDCGQNGDNCFIKDNTCMIDGKCHGKGEINIQNVDQFCDPTNDKSKWTSNSTSAIITQSPGSGLSVAPLGGVGYSRFDIWTTSKTGCRCAHDPTQTTCACCDVDGCQCPAPNQFQCVKCGDTSSCGSPVPGPDFGVDGYTLALNDCPCKFDTTRYDCACCQEKVSACPCGADQRNQCVNCDHMDQCGNKPWIFGPKLTK